MKIEIYQCDRCKKESKNSKDLELQKLVFGKEHHYFGGTEIWPFLPEYRVDWCLNCCKELGMTVAYNPRDRKDDDPKPPNMEDLIRDIVREEIRNQEAK